MDTRILKYNETDIAIVSSDSTVIKDVQSAIDMAMSVYETGTSKIIINKELVCEDFFILSTNIAGEILQKFTNYHIKMAIYGDYSSYTSKALKDFIFESNRGNDFFFVTSKEEALQKLSETQ